MGRVVAAVEVDERALLAELQDQLEPMSTVLARVARDVMDYVRGYEGLTLDDPPRPAHPGQWGDRTGNLAAGYDFEVNQDGDRWELVLLNHAPHAHLVESLDGFWVLRGVEKSSVYVSAFRAAIAKHMPGWEVRT